MTESQGDDGVAGIEGGQQLTYRAMGTDVHVIVVGGDPDLIRRARRRIDALDQRWSRFLDVSEITRLNDSAGEAMTVSEDTRLLIDRGIEGWRMSGGSFDPTVLGDVIRAGYVGDFDELPAEGAGGTSVLELGCERIVMRGDEVTLPVGTGFDSGGIGKGLAADVVVDELRAGGASGACVNIGGDLRVDGEGPEGGWTIAVDHPWSAEPVVMLGLAAGATASSTTLRRRWRAGGALRHHLIDPATGQPSDTEINFVVVVGAEAWRCEVMAKAVLLKGMPHPFDILGGTGMDALVVLEDGSVVTTSGLGRFLGDAAVPEHLEVPGPG